MKTFLWQGIQSNGQTISGQMTASRASIVHALLQQQGIKPQRIRRQYQLRTAHLRSTQTSVLWRQLAALLQAGMPLVTALGVMAQSQPSSARQTLLHRLQTNVAGGLPLSAALAQYPKDFSALSCHLIQAGERAAALSTVLEALAAYQENMQRLHAKVRKALIYPLTVLSVAMLITVGLLVFIVPQFAQLFANFGAELPWFTRLVLALASFISTKSGYVLLGLLLISGIVYGAQRRFIAMQQALAHGWLFMPVFGRLRRQAIVARSMRTLAILHTAGVPLIEALTMTAEVAQHPLYRAAFLTACQAVTKGETLHQALQRSTLFSPLVIAMLQVGEETARLSHMLQQAAEFYEARIEQIVGNLSTLLEPLLMIFLGVVIGGLVIALYLPIFQLGNVV